MNIYRSFTETLKRNTVTLMSMKKNRFKDSNPFVSCQNQRSISQKCSVEKLYHFPMYEAIREFRNGRNLIVLKPDCLIPVMEILFDFYIRMEQLTIYNVLHVSKQLLHVS